VKYSNYPKLKSLDFDNFKNQINYLQKIGNIITIEQIFDCINKNTDLPKNSFLLTFDDGLKDIYTYVFPFLKKNHLQGTFFPITNTIEKHFVADVHKIHIILANTNDKQKIVEQIQNFIKLYKKKFNLKELEEYYSELRPHRYDSKEINFIKQMLQRKLPLTLRKILVNGLFKKFVGKNEQDFSKKFYVSTDEMKEMSENGMIFGNHSYSHPWLTELPLDEVKKEIQKSNNFLKKFQPNGIKCISYPYGDFNQKIVDICRDERLDMGFTITPKDTVIDKKNALLLSRYDTNDFPQ